MNYVNKVCYMKKTIDMWIYSYLLKKRLGSCGKGTSFNGKMTVVTPWKISIGKNCSFNHGVYINAFNPITIGDDVTVSANTTIVSTGIDYLKWFSSGKKEHEVNAGLTIGNHVWIGSGASILSGANITGEYVVIAANSVVTKPVTESYCVLAGAPARLIKRFTKEEIGSFQVMEG